MTNIPMTHSVISPAAGVPGTLGITPFDFVAADNGVHSINNQTVSEVGVFRFTATPAAAAYFGETVPAGTSPNIGRFTPDHYAVTANTITDGCNAVFTYARQPFSGTMTLQAQAAAPGNTPTLNYRDGFDTLNPVMPGGELTFENSATAAAYDDTLVTIVAGQDFSNGTTGEANLNLQFRWDMGEQDETNSIAQLIATTDEVTTVSGSPATIGNTLVRFGRLNITNAFGSELLPLPMPMTVQTFASTSGYTTEAADGCTTIALPTVSLTSAVETVTADNPVQVKPLITTQVNPLNSPFATGLAGLSFTAPGLGGDGYVDITPDLTALPWLQFDWDTGSAGLENPTGRATFGVYKGNSQHIYFRERY
jgi:MSHA biogenesis protein MshQ